MHVLLRLRGTDTSETISTINLKGGILRFPVSFSILQVPENFLLKSFPCKCIHSHKTETQTGFVEPIGCCFILSFPSVSSSGKQLHHRKLFMPLEGSDLSALPQCDQSLQQKFSITQGYYSENFRSDCAGMQAALSVCSLCLRVGFFISLSGNNLSTTAIGTSLSHNY